MGLKFRTEFPGGWVARKSAINLAAGFVVLWRHPVHRLCVCVCVCVCVCHVADVAVR